MEKKFTLAPFSFPNYLRIEGMEEAFSVGKLTDEEAADYWDHARNAWLGHVRQRRELDQTYKTEMK